MFSFTSVVLVMVPLSPQQWKPKLRQLATYISSSRVPDGLPLPPDPCSSQKSLPCVLRVSWFHSVSCKGLLPQGPRPLPLPFPASCQVCVLPLLMHLNFLDCLSPLLESHRIPPSSPRQVPLLLLIFMKEEGGRCRDTGFRFSLDGVNAKHGSNPQG